MMLWWKSRRNQSKTADISIPDKPQQVDRQQGERLSSALSTDLGCNLRSLRELMQKNADLHLREFKLGRTGVRAVILFIEGLSDKDLIEAHIMRQLMTEFPYDISSLGQAGYGSLKQYLSDQVLTVSELTETSDLQELMSKVLMGWTALVIDGYQQSFILGTAKGKSRSIEEPESEGLVRGPRAGFTELISDNTALLRRHGENTQMHMIKFIVGSRINKELVVTYMADIADPSLVEEVIARIQTIDIDHVQESGYVEQLIEDNYLSPFPQVQSTERPDRVIAALLEGRVGILLDGTPFALIVPVTFSMLMQNPEDYNERWLPGSLIRLLRFGAALISLLLPAFYISFISFHPGLLPTKLAISVIGSREGVPFPSLVEALIMEISIEILREAGLRLPKPVGPAMGIVGGLIIGEAAVRAGIVSEILVIVVAVTAISSFAVPQYNIGYSLRSLRFCAMFSAAILGLYGVVLFNLLLLSHLVRLKSFGVPYMSPAVPYRLRDWKDFMIRVPLLMMKKRPKMMHTQDPKRKG